jgi:6-phosphogluconolactonase
VGKTLLFGLNCPGTVVFDAWMKLLQPALLFVVLLTVLLSMIAAAGAGEPKPATAREFWVYIGTYSGAKSKGIYRCRFDATNGRLTAPELAAETENPTFLAVRPGSSALYSVGRPLLLAANEVRKGTVSAYALDRATGALTFLNRQSSGGSGPCHLSVDRSGKNVLVANYGSGSVAVLPIDGQGHLGESTAFIQHAGSSVNKQRQEGPHAHWIDVDPQNRFALACDLGLDKVLFYKFDALKGTLEANDTSFATVTPGSGPRHLAFHPNGVYAYLINELASTVTAFAFHPQRAAFKEFQTISTLPAKFEGPSTTAEIEVHPSGRFVYGSNRGHNSIAVFAVDPVTGRLTLVEHQSTGGKTPRNFAIDPTGRWLLAANQDSDTVVVFQIDPETGRLKPAGPTVEVGRPVCVKFVPVN